MAYQSIYVREEDISKFKTIEKRIMIIEEKHLMELAAKVSCDLFAILHKRETLGIINSTTGNSETFRINPDETMVKHYKNKFIKLSEKEIIKVKYVLREVDKSKYDLIVIEKG